MCDSAFPSKCHSALTDAPVARGTQTHPPSVLCDRSVCWTGNLRARKQVSAFTMSVWCSQLLRIDESERPEVIKYVSQWLLA